MAHEVREEEKSGVGRLFARPVKPELLLESIEPKIRERFSELCQRFPSLREGLGDSLLAQFKILHSPFEYLTSLAGSSEALMADEKALLHDQMEYEIDRAASFSFDTPYQIYKITGDVPRYQIFPDPKAYFRMDLAKEGREYAELVLAAGQLIAEWNPTLWKEICFFVRDYALSWEESQELLSESDGEQPGHVIIYPNYLLDNEKVSYAQGSPVQVILMAAQMVHEGHHQKGFFFNRVFEFVQADYLGETIPTLSGHFKLSQLFDVALSVGYEYLFLKYALSQFDLGEFKSAFEQKSERKKNYLLGAISFGDQNQDVLTEQGRDAWAELINLWEQGLSS